jgi:hypothetical protein
LPEAQSAGIFTSEAHMILVRDIFQVKFGRMKEAKTLWVDALKSFPAHGGSRPRLLTDLTGQYYTLVLESTFKDLSDYETFTRTEMSSSGMSTMYPKFVLLVDSGRREMFTIVE